MDTLEMRGQLVTRLREEKLWTRERLAIEAGVSVDLSLAEVTPDVAWIARLGAIADPANALPKPLYLKGPDAKPQAHARVARR